MRPESGPLEKIARELPVALPDSGRIAVVDWRRYDNDGPDGVPNSGDDDGAVDIAVLLQPGSEYGCGPDSLRGFRETGYRLSLLPGWNGHPYVTSAIGASGTPIVIDDFVGARSEERRVGK